MNSPCGNSETFEHLAARVSLLNEGFSVLRMSERYPDLFTANTRVQIINGLMRLHNETQSLLGRLKSELPCSNGIAATNVREVAG